MAEAGVGGVGGQISLPYINQEGQIVPPTFLLAHTDEKYVVIYRIRTYGNVQVRSKPGLGTNDLSLICPFDQYLMYLTSFI